MPTKKILFTVSLLLVCFVAVIMLIAGFHFFGGPGGDADDSSALCEGLGCKPGYSYVGSVNSDLFHDCGCVYARSIMAENIVCFKDAQEAKDKGYSPHNCVD